MMPSIDTLAGWAKHYARIQGQGDWSFTVELVPGLQHEGADAWATVDPDVRTKTARVRVRDLDKTPIPGFDGDPIFEIRVTLSHEIWHLPVAVLLANPSIENEERLVEAAAQAVVRAEMGGGIDARVMARSIKAIPSALRARVAKVSASTRGRRGRTNMDAKAVLAAITGQDEAAALKILTDWAAEQIAAAAGGGEPDGDEAPMGARENDMQDPNKPANAPPPARTVARDENKPEDESARRARKAADALNKSAIRARIHEVRTVDGVTLPPALEQLILAETDIDAAEKLLKVAALSRGDGGTTRARSGETARNTPPPRTEAAPKYKEADLLAEGINPILAKQIAAETDPNVADMTVAAARRARTAGQSPWPTSAKPNGGAS